MPGPSSWFVFSLQIQGFCGALGRIRTCDLLIRSQTRLRTGGDREGHGETKPRFYQVLGAVGETGRDMERHGVVVPLWYERDAVHMQNRVGQQRVLVNLAQYTTSNQRSGRS
jgi:hypothetical protein